MSAIQATKNNQNSLYKIPNPPQSYHGPKGDELDIEEEIDDKIYVQEEYNLVHRKAKIYPVLVQHYSQISSHEPRYTSDNPQENVDADARIDQMLQEAGLDLFSDEESLDSEAEEGAENIEIREKIEEIKRIISVSTLFQEKVMLVNKLHEYAREIGTKRTIEHIVELIIPKVIHNEKPQVKKAIIPQLLKLAKFLIASKDGHEAVVNNLIGEYQALLSDQNPDISKKACESLLGISNLLSMEDRSNYILPIILGLAHDNEEEDSRCLALQLLSHFSSLVENEYLEKIIVSEIISLSDDPVLNVRRTTVVFLVNICKNVRQDTFESKLFPVYYKLAYDNVWGVRKAAVEILPDISQISSPELRSQHLVDLYKKFTQDTSKWVKMAAHQYLGPFIATLKGQTIDKSLVNYFLSMGDPRRASFNSDVAFHCAFNFPAVLLTLGKEKWPDLKRLYKILVRDNQWKVRKTLSYSLHEIAKILGPDLTEDELLPVLEGFLKDTDEIRNGVLIHLADFIRILRPKVREKCISLLGHLESESNHWRLRKLLAAQLKDCVELFEPKVVYKIHYPIALKLCKDEVAEVRTMACCNIPIILKTLQKQKSKDYFERVIEDLFQISSSERYAHRQIFVIMCANILHEDLAMFCRHFMPHFIEKQEDRVVNVRIVLARYCGRFLSNFREPEQPSETSSDVSSAVEEQIEQKDDSNIHKHRRRYERLLCEKKFMKMIIRLKNDEKPDVGREITENIDFQKLMKFIKQNEESVKDIDLLEEFPDDIEEQKCAHEDSETTASFALNPESSLLLTEEEDDDNPDFSLSAPNASVGLWSLQSTREIIDEVISQSSVNRIIEIKYKKNTR